jgi:hypothetical protein
MSNTSNNATTSLANAPDIRDIAPPIDIPSGLAWLWWGLAAVAIGIAALLFWRWRHQRAAQVPIIPVVPAHLRARQKLQEALALIAQPKPFVIVVSDTTRYYLEERFNFHAPERTTEELLYELQRTDLLSRDQKLSLGDFLQSCDLVKFAKYEPGEPELREQWRSLFGTEPPLCRPSVLVRRLSHRVQELACGAPLEEIKRRVEEKRAIMGLDDMALRRGRGARDNYGGPVARRAPGPPFD